MVPVPVATGDIVLALLILWATTGLTFIHLGVLAVRAGSRRFRRRAPSQETEELADLSLTFIVPVYNDALTVGQTLESILRQSVPPERIIVVNDGSTDGTRDVLGGFTSRGVDIIDLPKNLGKTHALDAALRLVSTDLVAITDADSIVHQDYIKHMRQSFGNAEIVAVGGAVESIPHTWVTAARQIEYMLTVRIDRDAETTMNALVVLPGVSTTYRTAILREMGFEFDTIAEDFDMTFRLQKAGKKITMNMKARVYTSDPPTLRAYHKQISRWYTDFWLVMKKHRSVLGKRVFGAVEVPMLVLNATVSSLLYLGLPIYLAVARPQALIAFFASGIAVDTVLVIVTWRVYRRNDVWWAMLSRVPTRFIGRYAYLVAMFRVAVGRPGLAWEKLERRATSDFLGATLITSDISPRDAVSLELSEASPPTAIEASVHDATSATRPTLHSKDYA